jgi:3-oxoacyl-[acyl-carrier-protein] synthase-3
MISVKIHSFARAIPQKLVTNQDLSSRITTSDEWITQRTGIKQRYWVEAGVGTSDLGVRAARRSFELAGITSVDCIVAATLSPDYNFPGIGVQIQAKLGLDSVPAYDIRNQCGGFLYGLEMARALIVSGQYKRILLVGAEVHSTGLDITDNGRDIAVLFGDGAGSCILENAETAIPASQTNPHFEILETELHANGHHAKDLWCEHPGSLQYPLRITEELVRDGKCFPTMNGRKVFENAVKHMVEVSKSVLSRRSVLPASVAHFIPHQANARINSMVADTLGINPDAVRSTIQKYGNTTAATIPIGFSEAVETERFEAGQYVLSAAFGSGFVWGAALFKVC